MVYNDATIQVQKQFTEYPEEMDKYFTDKKFIIKAIPEKYKRASEPEFADIEITSAAQCYNFIEEELKFWDDKDAKKINILNDFYTRLLNAKTNLKTAKEYYANNKNISQARYNLDNLCNQLQNDYLCSKTKLARYFIKNKFRDNNFFNGFDYALRDNSNYSFNSLNNTVGAHLGFIEGLNYLKIIEKVQGMTKEELGQISENVKEASESYADLNNRYTVAFHEQERSIEEIKAKNIDAIKKVDEASRQYFEATKKRSAELENLYENKLRIEKPADYWKQMHNMYSKKGKVWFGLSCFVAGAIVAMLICIIVFVPNIFDEQTHWFDILKNSAIVTVIAGVAIYVLRIFVKMALSSFHLARDAKEREQLSYYYLSLIQGKAITDRERALIINSLFSRSDTGLLKGDSTPTMATNISDIIETVTKK